MYRHNWNLQDNDEEEVYIAEIILTGYTRIAVPVCLVIMVCYVVRWLT